MSLNELIDNILLIARNSNITESEHLSRIQIEKWIIAYRAMLIKQDVDKGRDINPLYLTTIEPIHIDVIEKVPGKNIYVGDRDLPKLIDFNYRPGVINVRDMYGNIIQVGSYTKQSTSSVGSSAITSMLIYSSSFSSPSKYILLPLTQAM